MMTGWSSKGGQRQGMALGADDYLSKPFNASELIDAVAAQLKKKERAQTQVAKQTSASETSVNVLLPAEIGMPLQTIIGFGQILSNPGSELSRQDISSAGQQISAASFRIQRAVDNFVLYSQLLALESDSDALNQLRASATPDVKEFVDARVLNLARARGREADITLTTSDGVLEIESEYLGRLVDELVDNALKFSSPGEKIAVMCVFSPDRFGLAVTDLGRGMSPDQLKNINAFVQFGRLTDNNVGLGLGLAIARKIAFLHGGALSIKSKMGEKTRVAIELPRKG
jgi:two-component system, sensor histidine kinase and response regulator